MSQLEIKKVTVLGAGVMGAQIAALLADAGVEVHLLDLPGDEPGSSSSAEASAAHGPVYKALEQLKSLSQTLCCPLNRCRASYPVISEMICL